ncbi:hypothetical protein JCM10450v2_006369 [Rhodotorula kratochvilovae]
MSMPADPQRPFTCGECQSKYTRQEHLDRHVTAKHRVAKDFVCPVCSKGFARKDILKRHQQGHEKQAAAAAEALARGESLDRGYESPASAVGAKGKKKRPSGTSDINVDDGSGPAKIARVGRACCRCSKSKLRCDGQHPCERCRKAGIECSFERPPKSASRQGSVSLMVDDNKLGLTPSMESDGETESPENAFGLSLPTPPPPETWARQPVAAMSGMSPYHVPLRASPGHHLPTNSFPFGVPPAVNYYSGRPAEPSYYRAQGPYHNPAAFPSISLPHHGPSPLNPFASASALPHPPPVPASSSSQWDNSAYGRQIGDNSSTSTNQLGFLDLFSGSGNDPEIDWSVLGAGFNGGQDGSAATSAVPSAFTTSNSDLELNMLPGLGSNAEQPMSNLRHGGVPEEPSPASAAALVLAAAANGDDRLLPPPRAAAPKREDDDGRLPSPERPAYPLRNDSLVESDNAAVSLLQLASHTPRVSPEPGVPPVASGSKAGPAPHASALAHPHARLYLPAAAAAAAAKLQGAARPSDAEEAPRSSHPTHQPGDPWPLSYRPTEPVEDILPTSARGTGYLSRAASPPPHHPHLSLAHVPSVTEATRLRILYKVRELTAADPSLSERFVPRLELLELFIQLYFDKYHALFPLVHKPTWDPNTAPSFLVLAVASVGARYAWERVVGASMHAHALLECARRMSQIMGDLDNTLLRTVAWQQTLLIVLQSGMMSGNKRDLERTQAFASMPVTFARRQGWLKEPQVDEQAEELLSVDERWKRWRDREEVKRLGFGAVVFDCGGTALWNMDSSSLYLDAANTPLPCHDSLWDAPSATAWSSLFRHTALPAAQPTLSHAVHLACSFPSLSAGASSTLNGLSRDAFALWTVLSVLHSLGWERGHARAVERTFLTPGSDGEGLGEKDAGEDERKNADEVDAAQAALEAGVDYFQDRILLPPDMLARLEDPGAASGSMALFVHLTALTQRLPLRVLQPLARSATAPAQPGTHSALRSWALAGHGSVARTTAYHAAQLLALCRPGIPAPPPLVSASRAASRAGTPAPSGTASEGPLEPFALFYAALALVAFVREGGAPAPAPTSGEDAPAELALDVLRDRADAALGAWVHSGPLGSVPAAGGSAPTLVLRMLGDEPEQRRLDSPRAAARILGACARRLRELRVWKVGDLLAGVLEQFAAVERERVDEVEYEKAGRGAGGWGALLRSDSAAGSTAGAKSEEGGAGGGGEGAVVSGMEVDGEEEEEEEEDEDDEGEQDA